MARKARAARPSTANESGQVSSDAAARVEAAAAGVETAVSQMVDLMKSQQTSALADMLKNLRTQTDVTGRTLADQDVGADEAQKVQIVNLLNNMKRGENVFQHLLVTALSEENAHSKTINAIREANLAAVLSDGNEVRKRISMRMGSQADKAFDHLWNLEAVEAKANEAVLQTLNGPAGTVLIGALTQFVEAVRASAPQTE